MQVKKTIDSKLKIDQMGGIMKNVLAFIIVAFLIHCLAFTIHGQEGLSLEAYEDSVAAAKKNPEIIQTVAFRDTAPEQPSAHLTRADSAVIDSFELEISALDLKWNSCKRLRELKTIKDRLDALQFYRAKNVMTITEVTKYAEFLHNRELTEMDGTNFLIHHQSGQDLVRAAAHLKKVHIDLSRIENFLFALNNQPIKINK